MSSSNAQSSKSSKSPNIWLSDWTINWACFKSHISTLSRTSWTEKMLSQCFKTWPICPSENPKRNWWSVNIFTWSLDFIQQIHHKGLVIVSKTLKKHVLLIQGHKPRWYWNIGWIFMYTTEESCKLSTISWLAGSLFFTVVTTKVHWRRVTHLWWVIKIFQQSLSPTFISFNVLFHIFFHMSQKNRRE